MDNVHILSPGESLSERRRMAQENARRLKTEGDTVELARQIAMSLGMPYALNPHALIAAIEAVVMRILEREGK